MITFTALIKKFHKNGEKSGWTYIDIPSELANELLPNNKRTFRVKGQLDDYSFQGIGLLPVREGNFIMALNLTIRKQIKKGSGAFLEVSMELDTTEKQLSEEFLICLADEPGAQRFFNTLTKGHQRYFSNWIDSAKTSHTKAKRIAQALDGLANHQDFGQMIRMNQKKLY